MAEFVSQDRNNPRCRKTLRPKRYGGQMTEFDDSDAFIVR